MKNVILTICFLLTFVFFAFPLYSGTIYVIATPIDDDGYGTVLEKATTSFSEIVQTDTYSSGLVRTTEALKRASSVELPDYGGAVASPVSLRGSNFQQTLILLDGMRLNSAVGDITDVTVFPISTVHQIEVIKGSNSASFGPCAMGGVINIVTKRPGYENGVDFTSAYGSYGSSLYSATVNTSVQDCGLMASLSKLHEDNDFYYEKDDGTSAKRENNKVDNVSGLTKIWFDYAGWDTSVLLNHFEQTKGSPGSEGSAGWITLNDEVHQTQQMYQLVTSKTIQDELVLNIRSARNHNRLRTSTEYGGDSWTRLIDDNLEVGLEMDAGIFKICPGFYYLLQRINSDDYGIHSQKTISGTCNTALAYEPIYLSFTARFDKSSDFSTKWTYQTGAVWDINDWLKLKTNVGTGYREPTAGELYAPSTWYTFVPNAELEPERSFSWDIGPSVNMERFSLTASYFVTEYRDMIKMEYPAPYQFTYSNVSKTHASGIETNLWFVPKERVTLSANYIYSNLRYASGPYESKSLKQRPRQVANIQADFNPKLLKKDVNFFVSYQFRQSVYADDENTEKTGNRNIMNAGISLHMFDDVALSFQVKNIFDDTSPEFEDKITWGNFWYPLPGRTYNIALHLEF